jgi:NADPH:quinone reductase-like Zn-dependent oxidoreductase
VAKIFNRTINTRRPLKIKQMKAAVMYSTGDLPKYVDIPEPVPQSEKEVLVSVKAVSIKHFDKIRASGKHYSSETPSAEGRVIGGDGVCVLENGERVYGMGVSGMLAEKATIVRDRIVPIPVNLPDAVAAALPNAVIGAAMGLRFKADIRPGDTVLINGATGFTGRVAVQIAKHYGAKSIIATGRNPKSLEDVIRLGASQSVAVNQDDQILLDTFRELHRCTPIDIVIDYLWGHSAELILASLKGKGSFTHKTRYVSVGSMTGDLIQLSSSNLRGADLFLTGSGLGSWTLEQVGKLFSEILPEMFQLAVEGVLLVETHKVSLKDIAERWNLPVSDGRRVVVTI